MQPVALKTHVQDHRVNWLELFYDLIYVIVIARLTHMIIGSHGHAVALQDYVAYGLLFIPVWWAWTGYTMLTNRYGGDTTLERILTLAQMFGVIVLAVFVTEALGASAKAFALAYAFIRLMLILMYVLVHFSNSEHHPVTKRFISGFTVGACFWAASVFFVPEIMYIMWAIGLAIDMLTPVFSRHCLAKVSVHRSHLPERTGLLFIIVLGESLLALVNSLDGVTFDAELVFRLLLAFTLVSIVWWRYFEDMEHVLMGKLQGAAQLHIYGHLPIYIGLGLLAAFCHMLLDSHANVYHAGILFVTSLALIFIPLWALKWQYRKREDKT